MSESNKIIPFPISPSGKPQHDEENSDKNQPKSHLRTPGRANQVTELGRAAKNKDQRTSINPSQETLIGNPFSDEEFQKIINPQENTNLSEDSTPYDLEEILHPKAIANIIAEQVSLLQAVFIDTPKIQDVLDIVNQSQTQLTHSLILIAALYELTPYEDKEKIQFANLIHQLNLKSTNQKYNWKNLYRLSSTSKENKIYFIETCINNFYQAKDQEVHSNFYHLTPSTQI